MIEILAPAGDEKSAYAAINAGADAIYLGLTSFSARSSAENFGLGALENMISYAHVLGVKIYVAMNTLVKENELQSFVENAVAAWNIGADALIIQDMQLGAYLKETYPQMVLHLSTQAGVCNYYGALAAKKCGFSRVILARETKLEDIAEIAKIIETECFVQGALCTCFSGQCYLSSFAGGNSGNRGKCKQPCRKKYSINRKGYEEPAYRISLADLCVGEDIKTLAQAGVSSFKIEGRMRRPEYVSAAVNYYNKLLDGVADEGDFSALKRAYNRGNYTKGLAFGQTKSFISSAVQGHIGEYVGVVTVADGKYFCSTSANFAEGDCFKILRAGKELCGATFKQSASGGFCLASSVRLKNGDKVFITTDARLNQRLLSCKRKLKINLSAFFTVGEKPVVTVDGESYTADFLCQPANGRPLTEEDFKKCFDKLDLYPFEVNYVCFENAGCAFVPVSLLNKFRRDIYAAVYEKLARNGNEKIKKIQPLPQPEKPCENRKIAVMCASLDGVTADVGILRPQDYSADFTPLIRDFKGERFLYLPPYFSGENIRAVEGALNAFDGIYCGGNYALELAKKLKKKLFAGTGFNLSNSIAIDRLKADYFALSKELTLSEAKPLLRDNCFYLSAGGIKVMDLIYCPFSRSCAGCDKRNLYELTDENGRVFPLRRYVAGECRFEIYNCAPLAGNCGGAGLLADLTCEKLHQKILPQLKDCEALKKYYKNYTKGHTETPVR